MFFSPQSGRGREAAAVEGSRENQTTECSVVEQQQQSRGVDLLSSRRNAHCCIWCTFYPTTFCRDLNTAWWAVCSWCAAQCRFHLSHIVICVHFVRAFPVKLSLRWHQLLCHQTSCAPTSGKSQSSPLKSLCPSHLCFNHHQRPSHRAIFARTHRPAILVCSHDATTWVTERKA